LITSRRTHSSYSFGELAFLDEAPACALRSALVVARTGNAEAAAAQDGPGGGYSGSA
jgi:hypothetical protein